MGKKKGTLVSHQGSTCKKSRTAWQQALASGGSPGCLPQRAASILQGPEPTGPQGSTKAKLATSRESCAAHPELGTVGSEWGRWEPSRETSTCDRSRL